MINSGKLVISSILAVALLAAGASWWFRFRATHEAARFWGPEATVLIRDAPVVETFERYSTGQTAGDDSSGKADPAAPRWVNGAGHDISDARGLVHFRNALLEDRSYEWPSRAEVSAVEWKWGVRFMQPEPLPPLTIWFSPDWKLTLREPRGDQPAAVISSEPIAHGLQEYFSDLRQSAPAGR